RLNKSTTDMSLVIYLGVHAFHAAPEEALQRQHAAVVPISQVRDIRPHQTTYSALKNMTQAMVGRLQYWLDQGDVEHCTLAYPLPMPYIAALMAKGVSPETAVHQWQGQAERLITLFKQNRQRISLMAYPQAEQSETPGGSVVNTPVPVPHIASIYQLAAQHLIQQSPALEKTQAYLLACTQNAGETKPAPVPNITEAVEQHRRLRSENHEAFQRLEANEERHRALEDESQAAEQQLKRLQADFDQQAVQLQQRSTQQMQVEEERAQLEAAQAAKLQDMQQQQQSLNDENTLLLEQLHGVQEELEQYVLKEKTRQAELQQAEQRVSELEKTLQKQQAEHKAALGKHQQAEEESTRRETEQAVKLQDMQQQQQSLNDENALLLEQLHGVQEELEQYLLKEQTRQAELKQAEQRISKLEETLQKRQAEHQTALDKHQQAEEESTRRETEQAAKLQDMQQQQQSLNDENALLLEQLHGVQEELEQFMLNGQALEHDLSRYRHEKQALTQELVAHQTIEEWLRSCAAKAVKEATRSNRVSQKRLARHKQLLESSRFFDAEWYQVQYPDVANGSMDAAEHYLKHGVLEGRNPSPLFDALHYIASYPDVAAAGLNPLVHFIELGQAENRKPLPGQES
ncbi:hypothetical protein M1C61_16325, partial [Chromohalobacter israelensis]|nr:hypothetical protein [Chromohalobacter israelensis]